MAKNRPFNPAIPVPKGKPLRSLRDAVNYIDKLPIKEQQKEEWQTAMGALLVVIEANGPTMFARMAIMSALNRDGPPVAKGRATAQKKGRT